MRTELFVEAIARLTAPSTGAVVDEAGGAYRFTASHRGYIDLLKLLRYCSYGVVSEWSVRDTST